MKAIVLHACDSKYIDHLGPGPFISIRCHGVDRVCRGGLVMVQGGQVVVDRPELEPVPVMDITVLKEADFSSC